MLLKRWGYTLSGTCHLLVIFLLIMASGVQAKIFRWVDDEGRVHFSDQRPQHAPLTAHDLSQRYDDAGAGDVALILVPVDTVITPALEQRLSIATDSIRDIFAQTLGVSRDFSRFEVHVYGDRQRFIDDRNRLAPSLKTTTGFFDHRRNIAYVWVNRNAEALLEVVTHELAHAILDSHTAGLPKWLNEGLAEYVQRLRVSGQAVAIPPDRQNIALLRRHHAAQSLLSVDDFLALSNSEWLNYDTAQHIAYAQSWGLVFFLMSSSDGTRALAEALDAAAGGGQCCVVQMGSSYQGGIAALARDFERWQDAQDILPHHY